jgi:hypothetical protein
VATIEDGCSHNGVRLTQRENALAANGNAPTEHCLWTFPGIRATSDKGTCDSFTRMGEGMERISVRRA